MVHITFRLRSFYYNTVTITFVPRVHRYFVLSYLRFRTSPSQFGFLINENHKKNLKEPLQTILMSSRIRKRSKKRKLRSRGRSRSKKSKKIHRSSPTNEIITPMLFRVTQQHHKNRLRQLFLKYYEPLLIDGKLERNHQWTSGVGKNVMDHLRLHLTWVLKGEVFHWTDEQIGKKTLTIFPGLGKISSTMFDSHTR